MLYPSNQIKFYSSCLQGVCIAESAKFGAQCSDKLYLNRVGNHLEKAYRGNLGFERGIGVCRDNNKDETWNEAPSAKGCKLYFSPLLQLS